MLTASDLNAEYNNILNNALSLISPITGTLDLDGNELILDGDADTSITANTDDRIDFRLNGVDLFRMDGTVASPVNGLDFIARATGSPASIQAQGTDANVGIDIRDDNGNELVVFSAVASSINEVTITNAATGNNPQIQATGGNTNISLELAAKGTGTIRSISDLTLEDTDAGTGEGPTLLLDRNSSSPATSDVLSRIIFRGRDSAGSNVNYGSIRGLITDPTNGSEDGRIEWLTTIAGVELRRLQLGAGLFTLNATGGDQGVDTINASGIFDDGVQILIIPQATQAAIEAETNEDTRVTPDLVKFNPGVAKTWVKFDRAGTVNASRNIDSVTDSGTGNWSPQITTDFSSVNYIITIGLRINTGAASIIFLRIGAQAAGSFQMNISDAGVPSLVDPAAADDMHASCFGDQ